MTYSSNRKPGGALISRAYRTLLGEYGEQGWWPINGEYNPAFKRRKKTPAERFEICVGAILTQNTQWKNVERALANLREADVLSPEKISDLENGELATLIKPAGYYNLKARKLKEFAGYSGEIRREKLLGIWGCGRETVDSILLYAYDEPIFVVDAYTKRVFSRVGLFGEGEEYEKVREIFQESLPKDSEIFNEYHALIVEHAKRFCRKTPACAGCPMGKICKNKGETEISRRTLRFRVPVPNQ